SACGRRRPSGGGGGGRRGGRIVVGVAAGDEAHRQHGSQAGHDKGASRTQVAHHGGYVTTRTRGLGGQPVRRRPWRGRGSPRSADGRGERSGTARRQGGPGHPLGGGDG